MVARPPQLIERLKAYAQARLKTSDLSDTVKAKRMLLVESYAPDAEGALLCPKCLVDWNVENWLDSGIKDNSHGTCLYCDFTCASVGY